MQCNLLNEKVLAEFRSAFSTLGVVAKEVVVILFSSKLPEFELLELNIFYGSTALMLNAYGSLAHRKGVFYDPERFNTATYQVEWGERMFNRDGKVLPGKSRLHVIGVRCQQLQEAFELAAAEE